MADKKKKVTDIFDEENNGERQTEKLNDSSSRTTTLINDFDRSTIHLGSKNTYVKAEDLEGKNLDEEYTFARLLSAASGQSLVYLVINNKDKKKYVCKLYRIDATTIDKAVVEKLQNTIKSPYVIQIIKCGTYEGRFYTITPYYEEGSVIEHIQEIDDKLLKEKYINQLNEGLNAIHEADIFHCDIKPHNIYFADDRQRLVIGDFGIALALENFDNIIVNKRTGAKSIAKRDLQKVNATIAYLPTEGDEYASRSVDYFALGMTILNMAYKGDIYGGVSNEVVRDRLVNYGVYIPDNIDREVAALVAKMTTNDNIKRIGYDGVQRWCKNHKCYGKYVSTEEDLCPVNISGAVFDGVVYNSTQEYANAITDNWNEGLEYYLRDGITNDLARAGADSDFIKEISDIKKEYKEYPDFGLSITLMKLNPYGKMIFNGELFCQNFIDYIKYLDKALLDDKYYFSEYLIRLELENEIKTNRLATKLPVMTICDEIFSLNEDSEEKAELIRNYFTSESNIYFNGNIFNTNLDLAKNLFNENMSPSNNKLFFSKIFLEILMMKYEELEKNKDKINSISKIKDRFKRNGEMALLLTGHAIPTTIDEVEINNFSDIAGYVKTLYEKNETSEVLCSLFRDGTILKYYKLFDNPDKEVVSLLSNLENSKMDDEELLTYFYTKTQESIVFKFKGYVIHNIQELYQILEQSRSIEKDSAELLNSFSFRMWLEHEGYDDCANVLFNNQKDMTIAPMDYIIPRWI